MKKNVFSSIVAKLALGGFMLLAAFGLAWWHLSQYSAFFNPLVVLLPSSLLVLAIMSVIIGDILLPLRKITRQLAHAAQDPENIDHYMIARTRHDEIGEAQNAMNALLRRLAVNMAHSKRRLAAMETMYDGVFTVDLTGRLAYANPAYFALRGAGREAVQLGMPWLSAYAPAAARVLSEAVSDDLAFKGLWNGEISEPRETEGTRVFEITLTRLEDGGFIGQERDITLRKKTEGENVELQRLYAQSQKIEAVGRLTGGIAHDFNNMLAVISGNLELIEDGMSNDCAERPFLRAAQRAAFRGSELTQRLLSFSRRQVLSPRPLDMAAFIPESITLIARAINETIDIDYDIAPGTSIIRADAGQLENAMLNLVINARDAMPSGGRINLRAYNMDVDEKIALSYHVGAGPYVAIEVEDNGAGIAPDILHRVCEPFFTTKETGMGTGLGLSMVYGFVKQSGGFVDINSALKLGTKVRMCFPKAIDSTEAEKTGGPAAASSPEKDGKATVEAARSGKVVVVEDDPDLLETTCNKLARTGYAVFGARTAADALSLLRTHQAILLLTDIKMPGAMNGVGLAHKVLETYPMMKIILFSARLPEDGSLGAFPSQSVGCVAKPCTHEALIAEIDRLIPR